MIWCGHTLQILHVVFGKVLLTSKVQGRFFMLKAHYCLSQYILTWPQMFSSLFCEMIVNIDK